MANRLLNNVYIIDSAMGGAQLFNNSSASWLSGTRIQAIGFFGATTASIMELAFRANTNNVFLVATVNVNATAGGTRLYHLGGVRVDELTCKTLTTGSGWIYLV